MLIGSKIADSMITSVVASLTSEEAPPMIPAIASGPFGSAMTSVSGSRSRCTWSRVSSRSPAAARRTMSCRGRPRRRRRPRHRRCGSACRARAGRSCWRPRRSRSVGRPPRAVASGPDPATDRRARHSPTARRTAGTGPDRGPRQPGGRRSDGPDSGGSVSGNRIEPPWIAATSRASPTRLSASPRFGLTSTSSTTSP